MLKEIREALKTEVALVEPIRKKIRTTRDRERYDAWDEKRNRREVRRHLHLAACYVRGTPYAKCESQGSAVSVSLGWIADLLVEYGCVPEGTTRTTSGFDLDLANWLCQGADVGTRTVPLRVRPEKLYVVVRADLPPGLQATQAMHAQREFAEKYPEVEKAWHATSNTVAILSVPDEAALDRLQHQLPDWLCVVSFHEFDLGDDLTAICVEPKGGKYLRHLPLALADGKAA